MKNGPHDPAENSRENAPADAGLSGSPVHPATSSDQQDSGDEATSPPDSRKVSSVSWFYLLLLVLLIAAGSTLQVIQFESGVLVTQLLLILLPALIFLRFHNRLNREFTRFKGFEARQLPALLAIMIGALVLVLSYGVILGTLLESFGWSFPDFLPPPLTLHTLLFYYVLIALLPGFCEEFLFRGTIMPILEQQGILPALFFSSLLFALFHLSLIRLPGTFILGFVIGLVVIKTGSLLAGMFLHSLNNALAVSMMYLAAAELPGLDGTGEVTPGLGLILILLPISAAGLYFGFKKLGGRPVLLPGEQMLPRGWLNPAMILTLVLFLLMAALEVMVISGIMDDILAPVFAS